MVIARAPASRGARSRAAISRRARLPRSSAAAFRRRRAASAGPLPTSVRDATCTAGSASLVNRSQHRCPSSGSDDPAFRRRSTSTRFGTVTLFEDAEIAGALIAACTRSSSRPKPAAMMSPTSAVRGLRSAGPDRPAAAIWPSTLSGAAAANSTSLRLTCAPSVPMTLRRHECAEIDRSMSASSNRRNAWPALRRTARAASASAQPRRTAATAPEAGRSRRRRHRRDPRAHPAPDGATGR